MIRSRDIVFQCKEQDLILTPERALFWLNRRALILADVHIGKSGHFRKHGIAVPETVNQDNLQRLNELIHHFDPEEIFFLGDLFHSDKNEEWESFESWRRENEQIQMYLAIGNHDEHSFDDYQGLGLQSAYEIEIPPFIFKHMPDEAPDSGAYTMSGHIHPSVKLKGKGRQSVYCPCYLFGEDRALLPAFGSFTGTHRIKPKGNEAVFAVVEKEVFQLN